MTVQEPAKRGRGRPPRKREPPQEPPKMTVSIGNCRIEFPASLTSSSDAEGLRINISDTCTIGIKVAKESPIESTGFSFTLLNPKSLDGVGKQILQDVLKLYVQELPAMKYAANTGKESRFLENCIFGGKYCTLILRNAELELIGAMTYQMLPTDTNQAELPLVAISRTHHRKGLGAYLYKELQRRLFDVGVLSIFCWGDQESEAFWAKQGYVTVAEVDGRGKPWKLPIKADVRRAMSIPGSATLMISYLSSPSIQPASPGPLASAVMSPKMTSNEIFGKALLEISKPTLANSSSARLNSLPSNGEKEGRKLSPMPVPTPQVGGEGKSSHLNSVTPGQAVGEHAGTREKNVCASITPVNMEGMFSMVASEDPKVDASKALEPTAASGEITRPPLADTTNAVNRPLKKRPITRSTPEKSDGDKENMAEKELKATSPTNLTMSRSSPLRRSGRRRRGEPEVPTSEVSKEAQIEVALNISEVPNEAQVAVALNNSDVPKEAQVEVVLRNSEVSQEAQMEVALTNSAVSKEAQLEVALDSPEVSKEAPIDVVLDKETEVTDGSKIGMGHESNPAISTEERARGKRLRESEAQTNAFRRRSTRRRMLDSAAEKTVKRKANQLDDGAKEMFDILMPQQVTHADKHPAVHAETSGARDDTESERGTNGTTSVANSVDCPNAQVTGAERQQPHMAEAEPTGRSADALEHHETNHSESDGSKGPGKLPSEVVNSCGEAQQPLKKTSPVIMLMNMADENKKKQLIKYVERLSGTVTSDGCKCTHVVTGEVRRTLNFCVAISSGAWILSPEWLKTSVKQKSFADETRFVLRDRKFEAKYKVRLEEVIRRAKERPNLLLDGMYIYLTAHIHPPVDTISQIVQAAGGKVLGSLEEALQMEDKSKAVAVATEEDMSIAISAAKGGLRTFSSDWLLTCIVKHELDLKATQFSESL
ncbi:unnamed protein product [Calypogeia fissa]